MKDILQNLGCSEKETSVCIALFKFGISNATQISKKIGLPRQTVYSTLDTLIEKRFVEQTVKRGVRQYLADPFRIKSLIDDRKHELESIKKKLDTELTRMVSESSLENVELPRVQFYQGQEGLKRLLSSIIDIYKKSDKYRTFRGYAINEFYPGMEEFLENFVEKRFALGVKSQLFVPKETDFSKIGGGQNTFGREFKMLDINYHKAGFYIVGKRLYLFSYKDGVGVMIENANLANFFKDIFDDHWNHTN